MIISWLLFAILVGIFTYRGYRQGIWVAASRLLSLVLAYVSALLFSPRLAPLIESHTVIKGMAAYVSAGLVLFLGTSLLLSFLFSLFAKRARVPSTLSSALGAVMGFGIGSVVGLVAVFAFSYLVEVWPGSSVSLRDRPPNAIERLARGSASKVMSWIGSFSDMEPATAKLSAALVSEPRKVISHVQNLQRNPDMQTLFSEPRYQAVLSQGDVEAIRQLPPFQNLVVSEDMQALMEVSGLDESARDNEVVLAEQISKLWQRSDRIKNDARLSALLDDPELRDQLEGGNPAVLLNNEKFMEVVKLLLQDSPDTSAATQPQGRQSAAEPAEIYRWVDADGNVHYGDSKPGTDP